MDKTNEPIVLTERESLRLIELMDNPPPRNQKFIKAMAQYQSLIEQNNVKSKVS